MNKPKKPNRRLMKFRIELIVSSTLKAYAVAYDQLSATLKGCMAYISRLIFDFTESPPADLSSPSGDCEPAGSQSFVPATRPTDLLSREQAEQEGLIISMDNPRQTGPADDQTGAGGIPAEGYRIAGCNSVPLMDRMHRLFQNVIDYAKRILALIKGGSLNNGMSRVPVHIQATSVGGMGSGSLVWFLTKCIIACAQANGVEAKIIPEILILGNLQTHHIQKARINEYILLKFAQALATGTFVDPVTRRLMKTIQSW